MTIKRSPDFPEEAARLFVALTHCTDGHSRSNVLEASANLLVATILLHAREHQLSVPDLVRYAAMISENVAAAVVGQYNASAPSVASSDRGPHAT